MRETTTEKTQINSVSSVAADSAAVTSAAIQNAIKTQVDSLLLASFQQAFNQESETAIEQTLRLVLYDTTQPSDTATGLPPVRAALTKHTAATRKDKSEAAAQATVRNELKKEHTDSTAMLEQSAARVQRIESDSLDVKTDSKTVTQPQRSSWRAWLVIVGVVVLVITACVIILRRKLKHLI